MNIRELLQRADNRASLDPDRGERWDMRYDPEWAQSWPDLCPCGRMVRAVFVYRRWGARRGMERYSVTVEHHTGQASGRLQLECNIHPDRHERGWSAVAIRALTEEFDMLQQARAVLAAAARFG